MIITKITRKVTGNNYDNIELTAEMPKDCTIEEAKEKAVELDITAREMLDKIYKNENAERERNNKKYEMLEKINRLKKAVENEKVDELPF